MLGQALCRALTARGDTPVPMVRPGKPPGEGPHVGWDPAKGSVDLDALDQTSGVIHLAGEPVMGVWTAKKRERILDSRVLGTTALAGAVASLAARGRVLPLVSASGVGYYGDRGDTPLDESSDMGEGFLAEVVRAWEGAAQPARDADAPVSHLRLGVVLSHRGGALGTMLTPFKMGVGGKLGSGAQYMPWVSLNDVVRAFLFALDQRLSGVFNVASPGLCTNRTFTKSLGRVLKRPTVFAMPKAVLETFGGDLAREMLLSSARVQPQALLAQGFVFEDTDVESFLTRELA